VHVYAEQVQRLTSVDAATSCRQDQTSAIFKRGGAKVFFFSFFFIGKKILGNYLIVPEFGACNANCYCRCDHPRGSLLTTCRFALVLTVAAIPVAMRRFFRSHGRWSPDCARNRRS